MRILVVNETLDLGGAETMAVELANGLSALSNLELFFAAPKGILEERLASPIKHFSYSKYSFLKIFRIISEFKNILIKIKPDVIHSQGATVGVLVGIAARAIDKRIKLIMTHHSNEFVRVPKWLGAFLFNRYFDQFIAISRNKHQRMLSIGMPSSRVSLIPNFVNWEAIQKSIDGIKREDVLKDLGVNADAKVIITTGRLISGKRLEIFIEILSRCAKQTDKKIVGLIVGDGPERKKLERLAGFSGRSNLKMLFLGFQKDVFKYLLASDVFLFTSESEVLPMCLIEACALGLPVVCSDIPGNDEIVEHGETGFLVKSDIAEYCEKVQKILNDDVFAAKLSEQSRKRAARLFEKKVVVDQIVEVYWKVLGEDKRAPFGE